MPLADIYSQLNISRIMKIDVQVVYNPQFDETELVYKTSHILPGELELALIEASVYYIDARFQGEFDGETLQIDRVTDETGELTKAEIIEMAYLCGDESIVWPIN